MLRKQYEWTGDIVNLEEAIQVARQAVILIPKDYSDLAMCLNNLGSKLKMQYERTGDMAHLEEAIQVARQAVALIPNIHSNLAGCLSNLGNMLESQSSGRETWPTSRRLSKSLDKQLHRHLKTTLT